MPHNRPLTILLAPLITYLQSCPLTTNINLDSGLPLTPHSLDTWDRLHAPDRLPQDLRSFLMVSDGMKLTWDVRTKAGKVIRVGYSGVNQLSEMKAYYIGDARGYCIWEGGESGRVLIILSGTKECERGIWCVKDEKRRYLAKDFAGYFRSLCFCAGVSGFWLADDDGDVMSAVVRDWVRFYGLTRRSAVPRDEENEGDVDIAFDSGKASKLIGQMSKKR
ncbi:hypothetical protein SpCBS45565_g05352 [Spizellomyces sp. 'palustris']|nr:hypothetical protein SpCBS45565_g05352 [Spizellomyces sp. 'palustris']